MKYYVQIGQTQNTQLMSIDEIAQKLQAGELSLETDCMGEQGGWEKVRDVLAVAESADPQSASVVTPKFVLPPIERSAITTALTIVAVLEFVGAIIGGFAAGSGYEGNAEVGWLIFAGGIISGLILLGFAGVIQNTFESSQRLRRLEMLMERSYDDKRAA